MGEPGHAELREVVVVRQRLEAARLHVDLVDQLRPRFPRGGLRNGARHLPLGAAVAELGVWQHDVGVVVPSREDPRRTLLQGAGRQELTDVRAIGQVGSKADEPGAVRKELGRRDRRVPGTPFGDLGDRCVDVKEALVVKPQQDTRGDHLARRCDQRHAVRAEVTPVLLSDDPVVAIDDDQAGTVEVPFIDEPLDDGRHCAEVQLGCRCPRRCRVARRVGRGAIVVSAGDGRERQRAEHHAVGAAAACVTDRSHSRLLSQVILSSFGPDGRRRPARRRRPGRDNAISTEWPCPAASTPAGGSPTRRGPPRSAAGPRRHHWSGISVTADSYSAVRHPPSQIGELTQDGSDPPPGRSPTTALASWAPRRSCGRRGSAASAR